MQKKARDIVPGDLIPLGSLYRAMGEFVDAYTEAVCMEVESVEGHEHGVAITDEEGFTYHLHRDAWIETE